MSTKLKWTIPSGITPTCFTNVTHSIKDSSSTSSMESWSVEEIDINHFALNFRTTSSQAGNILYLYSNYYRIGTIELDNDIEAFIFYSIKIEYPKTESTYFTKYTKVLLNSQSSSPYPVFTFNSHTHIDLLNPSNNRYIPSVSDSQNYLVNELGCIAVGPNELINASMLSPDDSPYITPVITDIYDFR